MWFSKITLYLLYLIVPGNKVHTLAPQKAHNASSLCTPFALFDVPRDQSSQPIIMQPSHMTYDLETKIRLMSLSNTKDPSNLFQGNGQCMLFIRKPYFSSVPFRAPHTQDTLTHFMVSCVSILVFLCSFLCLSVGLCVFNYIACEFACMCVC